jgi:hypothetical protein
LPPNALKVEIKVFLEVVCSEAESFSKPQLPTKVAFLKLALLAQLKN